MSIRLYISYTRCSNCELKKSIKLSYDTVIKPKDGVYESSTGENYCENCENSTMWFMGKVDEIDRLRYSLIMNKMKIGNLTQDLENNSKIIERYSNVLKRYSRLLADIRRYWTIYKRYSTLLADIQMIFDDIRRYCTKFK